MLPLAGEHEGRLRRVPRRARAAGAAGGERLFQGAFASLAKSYAAALSELEKLTGKKYGGLCIVGGGAKNTFLNELTERACGVKVHAYPIEATALGNLKIQAKIQGE